MYATHRQWIVQGCADLRGIASDALLNLQEAGPHSQLAFERSLWPDIPFCAITLSNLDASLDIFIWRKAAGEPILVNAMIMWGEIVVYDRQHRTDNWIAANIAYEQAEDRSRVWQMYRFQTANAISEGQVKIRDLDARAAHGMRCANFFDAHEQGVRCDSSNVLGEDNMVIRLAPEILLALLREVDERS